MTSSMTDFAPVTDTLLIRLGLSMHRLLELCHHVVDDLLGSFLCARLEVLTPHGATFRLELGDLEVDLLSPGRAVTELPFDALGLGRGATRTFVVRRGDRQARLTTSSYGRVKRW